MRTVSLSVLFLTSSFFEISFCLKEKAVVARRSDTDFNKDREFDVPDQCIPLSDIGGDGGSPTSPPDPIDPTTEEEEEPTTEDVAPPKPTTEEEEPELTTEEEPAVPTTEKPPCTCSDGRKGRRKSEL
eukprot:Trichotokara_eunicae@DN10638_c0_g1_i1.p1